MPFAFTAPPITVTQAHQLAGSFAVSYVGSLYLFKNARLSFADKPDAPAVDGKERERYAGERWRNDPAVIRARLLVVSVISILVCFGVFVVLWSLNGGLSETLLDSMDATFARLGFILPNSISDAILPCLVIPALYLGPLYVSFLDGTLPFQSGWSIRHSVAPYLDNWAGWRNVVVGPISEEVVFRACILAVYKMAGSSTKKMVYLTPLWFGLAHLHHAWDTYNRYGRNAAGAKRAFLTTLVQLTYTTLFGFHCAFLFLRTGALLSPVASHIFCNIMGLPTYPSDIKIHPRRKTPITIIYLLGVAAYIYTLIKWTAVKDNLYWPVEGVATRY